MNLSMDTATGVIAGATALLGPEKGKKFQDIFASNLTPVAVNENMNWRVGESGIGASTASKIAGTYWNDNMNAIRTAALSIGGKGMDDLADWASINMLEDVIDPTAEAARAEHFAWIERLRAERAEEQRISGGAATGGVVVPSGEDGFLGVQKKEGILPIKALEWAEDVGNTILKTGGVFGGTAAIFDKPGMGSPVGGGAIFGGGERGAVMSELLLNDVVTRQGRTNEGIAELVAAQNRSSAILERIANLIESGDEEGARLLKAIVSKPDGVMRNDLNLLFDAASITVSQRRGYFG